MALVRFTLVVAEIVPTKPPLPWVDSADPVKISPIWKLKLPSMFLMGTLSKETRVRGSTPGSNPSSSPSDRTATNKASDRLRSDSASSTGRRCSSLPPPPAPVSSIFHPPSTSCRCSSITLPPAAWLWQTKLSTGWPLGIAHTK